MHISTRSMGMTGAGLLALVAGAAPAGPDTAFDQVPEAVAASGVLTRHLLADHLFALLPAAEQARIARAGGPGVPRADVDGLGIRTTGSDEAAPASWRLIESQMAGLTPDQRRVVENLIARTKEAPGSLAVCLAPDADPAFVDIVNRVLAQGSGSRFQQTGRWTATAYSGGGLGQGDPTIISYSYVPDGVFVPDGGLGTGNNQLTAWLNGIYGSPANWRPLFDDVFARWAELTGTSYVFEPNDDGAALHSSPGVAGVRGDVRIAAIPLDGNSGVLAYNYFPQNGDMVFDAFDSFYNATGGGSIRMRNVISHEHGHGLGMLHVCPANGSKLMEPFINTSFDGPQLDDILNGQRHYGDDLEPSDSRADAADLGAFSIGTDASVMTVSIDDNADQDYYRVETGEPLQLTIDASPAAAAYLQGPQTANCNTGSLTNYDAIHDLQLRVLDADGALVDSSNASGVGETETLEAILDVPGVYYVVVSGGSTNSIQLYDLDVAADAVPFLGPKFTVAGVPDAVLSGEAIVFDLTIEARQDVIVAGSPAVSYRFDGGSFVEIPLQSNGGDSYTAQVPAPRCADAPELFLSVEGVVAGTVTFPETGVLGIGVGTPIVAFEDAFESDTGWTVSGDVTTTGTGVWQRGVPANGDRADPPADADGSGQCYLTGNQAGNTDVDGGSTVLTSPVFDVAGDPNATVSYSTWYNNAEGNSPSADTMVVEISNDGGGSWTTLEVIGPGGIEAGGGWFAKSFRIGDTIAPSDQMRVRFTASDLGSPSLVEAGVDAFRVDSIACEDPDLCPADLNGDGELDFFDVSTFLGLFGAQDPRADFTNDGAFDFFDVSAFLAAFNAGCP